MKQLLQAALFIALALMLQSCASSMNRVKTYNALDANDIDAFKAMVDKIQTNPRYSKKSRANKLYDSFLIAAKRNIEATTYMLDQGIPIDYPAGQPDSTKRGMVLTGAVEGNQPEIVSLLLERGADPNIELWSIDPRNNILYISFMHKDLVISRILLEGGANPNQWKNPFYPSLLAHYKGHPEIQSILKEFGGVNDPSPEQRAGHVKNSSTPKAVTTSAPATKATSNKTVEERLQTITELKEQGVISEEEYSEARREILADL